MNFNELLDMTAYFISSPVHTPKYVRCQTCHVLQEILSSYLASEKMVSRALLCQDVISNDLVLFIQKTAQAWK